MRRVIKISTVFLTVAMLLAACGGDRQPGLPAVPPAPVPQPQPEPEPVGFEPGTHPRFDPARAEVPLHSDLVFAQAAASDGTADVGAATNPVSAAINQLDGFSTSAVFDVMIEGSLDAASAIPLQSVFVVEVNSGGKDALDPANITGLVGPAEFAVNVVSLDGGSNNALRIVPLKPLKAGTKYLVFLTNDLHDTAGKPLTQSLAYHQLRSADAALPPALAGVHEALVGWEQLAGSFLMAASHGQVSVEAAIEKLVLAYTFTTTDPTAVLLAMAAPRAALTQQLAAAGEPSAVARVQQLFDAGLLPVPAPRPLAISPQTGIDFNSFSAALTPDAGKLYTGYIRLPYYLTGPDQRPFADFLSHAWQPDLTLAAALSLDLPADLDGSYNLTYRYPFAAATAEESVPLQLTLPEAQQVPEYAGARTCSQVFQASGYPVVIFVHGITSDRSSVIALAHSLAKYCVATVAIDLPLHGIPANSALAGVLNVEHSQLVPFAALYGHQAPRERHFEVAGATGSPAPMNFASPGINDGSGTQFINLGNLANTRDNSRQAVMDLLNLNASLASVDAVVREFSPVGLDTDRVNVVGLSLGAILGSVFTGVNEAANQADTAAGFAPLLPSIRGLVVSAPGAQVSRILAHSPSFGPLINGGLAAAGIIPDSADYESFMYVAQSMMDAGDPVSFSGLLRQQSTLPVLIQQINDDTVIPNEVAAAPLAGTRGLAELLGAQQLSPGIAEPGRGIVKVTGGEHASLLRPGGLVPQVTAELQAQVISFVLDHGQAAIGTVAPETIEQPAF